MEAQNQRKLFAIPSHSSMGVLLPYRDNDHVAVQKSLMENSTAQQPTKAVDDDAVKICEFPEEQELNTSVEAFREPDSTFMKTSPQEPSQSVAEAVLVHHTQKASWSTLDGNIDSPIHPASRHSPTGSALAGHQSLKAATLLNRIKSGELAFHQLMHHNSSGPQRKLKIRLKGKSDIPSTQIEAEQKENADPQHLQPTASVQLKPPKGCKSGATWTFGGVLDNTEAVVAVGPLTAREKKRDGTAGFAGPAKTRPVPKGCGSRKLSAQATGEVRTGSKGHKPLCSGITTGTIGFTVPSIASNRGSSQEWIDEPQVVKFHDRHPTEQSGMLQRSNPTAKLGTPKGTAYIKTQSGLGRAKPDIRVPPMLGGSTGYYFIPTHLKSVSSPLGKLIHNSSRTGTERERESSSNTARTANSLWAGEEDGRSVKKIVLSPQEARKLQQGEHLIPHPVPANQTPEGSKLAWGVLDHPHGSKVDLMARMVGGFRKPEQTWLAKVQERMSPNIFCSKASPTAASPRSARIPVKTLFSHQQSPVGSSKYLTFETYFDVQDAVCR